MLKLCLLTALFGKFYVGFGLALSAVHVKVIIVEINVGILLLSLSLFCAYWLYSQKASCQCLCKSICPSFSKGISVVLLVQSVNAITFGAEGARFDTHYHHFFS